MKKQEVALARPARSARATIGSILERELPLVSNLTDEHVTVKTMLQAANFCAPLVLLTSTEIAENPFLLAATVLWLGVSALSLRGKGGTL